MKNRFMQHSERLKVIQTPFYGACGVSGLILLSILIDNHLSTTRIKNQYHHSKPEYEVIFSIFQYSPEYHQV
jgi:hypothetical protein